MGPVALHDILRTRLWLGAEKEGVAGHYAVFLSRRRNEISAPVVLRPCYDALLCSKNVTHLPLMLVAYFCCCVGGWLLLPQVKTLGWGTLSTVRTVPMAVGGPFTSTAIPSKIRLPESVISPVTQTACTQRIFSKAWKPPPQIRA